MLEKLIRILEETIEACSGVAFLDLVAGEDYKELLITELREFMCYVSCVDEGDITDEEISLYNRIFDEDFDTFSLNDEIHSYDFADFEDSYKSKFIDVIVKIIDNGSIEAIDYKFLYVLVDLYKVSGYSVLLSRYDNLTPANITPVSKIIDKVVEYIESKLDSSKLLGSYKDLTCIKEEKVFPKEEPEIKKEEILDDKKTLEDYLKELNELIGLEHVKEDVNSLINILKINMLRKERGLKQPTFSNHLVFSGNPGTGKTTVARLLAKIYYKLGFLSTGVLVETDRSGLVAGYVGQTAIKTKKVIESAMGGVLFIDEAYSLTESSNESDYGDEAIDTLLKAMEDHRDDFIVIVAGYPDLMRGFVESNPGLKSRFNKYIFFDDYDVEELTAIFISLCNKDGYYIKDNTKAYIRDMFENILANKPKNFGNGRVVRNIYEKALTHQANRLVLDNDITNDELMEITIDDIKKVKINDVK